MKIFPDDISMRLSTLVKWTAAAHGLPAHRFATHPLRSGGASAMFVAGVSFRDIKRFGWWSSSTVRIYLFHDDATYKDVGKKMVQSQGLLRELKHAVDTRGFIREKENVNGNVELGDNFRCGGNKNKT